MKAAVTGTVSVLKNVWKEGFTVNSGQQALKAKKEEKVFLRNFTKTSSFKFLENH